jgi:hypothetical protein
LGQAALKVFQKEFSQLLKVYAGILGIWKKSKNDFSEYGNLLEQAVKLFAKKYGSIKFLFSTIRYPALRIFVKASKIKDVFKHASKINGLQSIGVGGYGKVKVEETDKFSKEIDTIHSQVYLTFGVNTKDVCGLIIKHSTRKGMVEVSVDAFGFTDYPDYYTVRKWLKGFNPTMGDF